MKATEPLMDHPTIIISSRAALAYARLFPEKVRSSALGELYRVQVNIEWEKKGARFLKESRVKKLSIVVY